jgi:hypothetical protein
VRYRYYAVVQDVNGNVVNNAEVNVYLAGTNIPATIYLSRTSGVGISTLPQTMSQPDGVVVFWVDNNDYSYMQLFDIVIMKDLVNIQLSDVQIIIWDAVKAGEADRLNGQSGSYYLNRSNHVGTQMPNTISPQGEGSNLNADKVDGMHKEEMLVFSMLFGG